MKCNGKKNISRVYFYLGLDNIGVFDRNATLPDGMVLEQSDGTAWMGMFAAVMLAMALELARTDPVFEDMATKLFDHFLYIVDAIYGGGESGQGLWDDEDGFKYHEFYGDDFTVECPTGSGTKLTLRQVAQELARRLTAIFLRDEQGHRAVFGDNATFQHDAQWRDYIPFHEYIHGESGRGVGASHQTGWTAVVANLLQAFLSSPT